MFEIVERSMVTGGVSMIFGGYADEEDAICEAEELSQKNDEYWYEVRQERY